MNLYLNSWRVSQGGFWRKCTKMKVGEKDYDLAKTLKLGLMGSSSSVRESYNDRLNPPWEGVAVRAVICLVSKGNIIGLDTAWVSWLATCSCLKGYSFTLQDTETLFHTVSQGKESFASEWKGWGLFTRLQACCWPRLLSRNESNRIQRSGDVTHMCLPSSQVFGFLQRCFHLFTTVREEKWEKMDVNEIRLLSYLILKIVDCVAVWSWKIRNYTRI